MAITSKHHNLNPRRQMIFRRVVLGNRPLTVKELCESLDLTDYNEEKAERDAEDFRKVGCNIVLLENLNNNAEKMFVFLDGPHTDMHPFREAINAEEKALAARLAATVICGSFNDGESDLIPEWAQDPNNRKALEVLSANIPRTGEMESRLKGFLAQVSDQAKLAGIGIDSRATESLVALLKQSSLGYSIRQKTLIMNLQRFWKEPNRLVAIDSGTTNIKLAECLRPLVLPMPRSRLFALTVCTNCRRIFEVLGPADVAVRTIIIGGQQKFQSSTIAGTMAENFLRTSTILQFGMCVLGSTKVDIEQFAICSDTEEEASLKILLMERSSLKVICVDSSKLHIGVGREGYKFASIDPKHVDLIITNSPLKDKPNSEQIFKEFAKKVGAIEGRGVPVLVATSDRTFGNPTEEFETV